MSGSEAVRRAPYADDAPRELTDAAKLRLHGRARPGSAAAARPARLERRQGQGAPLGRTELRALVQWPDSWRLAYCEECGSGS